MEFGVLSSSAIDNWCKRDSVCWKLGVLFSSATRGHTKSRGPCGNAAHASVGTPIACTAATAASLASAARRAWSRAAPAAVEAANSRPSCSTILTSCVPPTMFQTYALKIDARLFARRRRCSGLSSLASHAARHEFQHAAVSSAESAVRDRPGACSAAPVSLSGPCQRHP